VGSRRLGRLRRGGGRRRGGGLRRRGGGFFGFFFSSWILALFDWSLKQQAMTAKAIHAALLRSENRRKPKIN